MTDILAGLTDLGTASLALLGTVIAGGAGGWISTWLTNKSARQRQQADHDHAQRLADERLRVDKELAEQRARADAELAEKRAQQDHDHAQRLA